MNTTARRGPTLRRDGRNRLTLKTAHHVDGVDIALMLCCYWASGYALMGVGQKLSRAALDTFVRRVLTDYGNDARSRSEASWADDHTCDEAEQIATWAVETVRRVYPELDDKHLDAFLREFTGPPS